MSTSDGSDSRSAYEMRTDQQRTDDGVVDPDQLSALVRECISLMREGGISRLELKYGSLELNLRSHAPAAVTGGYVPAAAPVVSMFSGEAAGSSDSHVVTAPMIGTFYQASAPGEPPFVLPGDSVEEGQTIGIIEAMKIMNEIAADRAGIVEEVIAINGQTVEYGSPLIRLSLTAG